MSFSIGIDLGTTFSAVATIASNGEPKILLNRYNTTTTPSVIRISEGKVICGRDAERAFQAGMPDCFTAFKRYMGKFDWSRIIEGEVYDAEKLSGILLKHLKEDAESQLGNTIENVVITVPAYFFSIEREATINAAKQAGFKKIRIIDEPDAAALTYAFYNWRKNANILVYDLGGGTFDVTLVHLYNEGNVASIVSNGNSKLGGKDWDERLKSLLIEKCKQRINEEHLDFDINSDNRTYAKIIGLTEEVKKGLSSGTSYKTELRITDVCDIPIEVTLEEFNLITKPLLQETVDLCQLVLNEAKIDKSQITDILLVGGSTRMKQVSDYLEEIFGKRPIAHVNPDEAVALGAAIETLKFDKAYVGHTIVSKDGNKEVDRSTIPYLTGNPVSPKEKCRDINLLTLSEVTAHAMGIIAKDDDKKIYYNEIIIPSNHPRPVRYAKKFRYHTSSKSDNEIEIYVLQGSSNKPLECSVPFKYLVSGIRHIDKGSVGTLIRVQYTYDVNGIIRVQARQENDTVDLPIRKDKVPNDMSKYGKPIENEKHANTLFGLLTPQKKNDINQDVISKYKQITFSNVSWTPYDNIMSHPSGAKFNEPKVHKIAKEKKIEFVGYNVSAMDEGYFYKINPDAHFEIDCDIDVSTIQPHPGGCLTITLGIITLSLNEKGGSVSLIGKNVYNVGTQFNLKMIVSNEGNYQVYIDKNLICEKQEHSRDDIEIRFGFTHGSHCCHLLSKAYISNIDMKLFNDSGDNLETDTWDD